MLHNVKTEDLKTGDIIFGREFYLLCFCLKKLDKESFRIKYIGINGKVTKTWIEACEQFSIWRTTHNDEK
jgi:hypothetical protein